jgi:hypothetical protein
MEEDKLIISVSTMITLTSLNYHIWINELKAIAEKARVWKFIDPDTHVEEPQSPEPFIAADYLVMKEGGAARSAINLKELTAAQREEYKADMLEYNMLEKLYERTTRGLQTIDNAIRTSAKQYISPNELGSPARKIIQLLAARYKLDQSKIIQQIHEQWRGLKVSPTKGKDKIEAWIVDWENLRLQMISLKLAGTFGDDVIFVSEFLRAGRRWAPTFCDNWENQLEAAEKEVEFFKTTRAYRNAVLKESFNASDHSSYANAATLQDKISDQSDQKSKDQKNNLSNKRDNLGDNPSKKGARKCVCGDIHEFKECPYIVSSARTSDWTEDKKILDQIKQQLQEKSWILNILKRICNINLLNEIETPIPSAELETSFSFGNFSFANTVLRESTSLSKSVIYDSGCSDPLTYDKDRFLGEIKPVSKDSWIKTPNGRMKVKGYGTMQVLGKSGDKIIKMEFANTAYVPITSMTLVSSTKLIKEGYDRDMHTKTLVHVAIGKKVCDIEEHFGVMTLEYVENAAPINFRNEVLNQAPNKKIEVLNDQAPKEVEKTPQSITNSEPIIHGKSGTEPHIMDLNQSDEGQQNPSLNNSHPSRQVDSGGGGDQFTKASNANGGPKERFTKAPHSENGGLKKQAKSVAKTHHKDSNRTEKAWWRPPANGVQITPQMEFKKRPPNEGFSGGQYEFLRHAHQGMQQTAKLGQERDNFPEKEV